MMPNDVHQQIARGASAIGNLIQLDRKRLARAKVAYSTRRVAHEAMATLIRGDAKPRPGDLVLASVGRLGQHQHLELADGRRSRLYVGNEIIVCYANRYAPDQFEALVPDDLGTCELVAAGGIAARSLTRHDRMKAATEIMPLGLVGDINEEPINLASRALPAPAPGSVRPYVVAVVGTSMNAGKTTTAASLINGLTRAGLKVGAAKVTGTGAGCDRWSMVDAGAFRVLDFTDAGFASTYRLSSAQVEHILMHLTGHLAADGADFIVLEVADGLFQDETSQLLASPVFRRTVNGVLFAAGDAMGAAAGASWLRKRGIPVLGISGLLTASPLAMREAGAASGLPVLSQETLRAGSWRPDEVAAATVRRQPRADWAQTVVADAGANRAFAL
jgi:molybdopterin cofactor biosynthesis protein B